MYDQVYILSYYRNMNLFWYLIFNVSHIGCIGDCKYFDVYDDSIFVCIMLLCVPCLPMSWMDTTLWVYLKMIEIRCRLDVVTYNTLIKLFLQEGWLRQVYLLLDKMLDKGCLLDVIKYNWFFSWSNNNPRGILKLRFVDSSIWTRMDTSAMRVLLFDMLHNMVLKLFFQTLRTVCLHILIFLLIW